MGKSLASLFGVRGGSHSSKKISKLKNLLGLAVARLTILKNQHQARCSLAHSDIAQLLQLGHRCDDDRALLRAEIVVKEENMLDVFAIIQSYCHLVAERAILLQREKECPRELKEAVSSLVYASSRSGEMPELHHVSNLFSSMFGREFVRAVTELRNSCGVNPKIVQKLSTKQPSLESRMRIIREIATEKGIPLDLNEDQFATSEKVDLKLSQNQNQSQPAVDAGRDSSSGRSMHNYKDVASAAQAAFEKAEDAAAAARAAVELSISSQSSGYHDNRRNDDENKKKDDAKRDESNLNSGKTRPAEYYSSESDEEEEDIVLFSGKNGEISEDDKFRQSPENFQAGFYSDFSEVTMQERKPSKFASWGSKKKRENETESENKLGLSSEENEGQVFKMERQFSKDTNEDFTEKQAGIYSSPLCHKRNPARKFITKSFKRSSYPESDSDTTGLLDAADEDYHANSYYTETRSPQTRTVHVDYTKKLPTEQSKVTRRAVSVRTRRGMQK